MCLKSAVNIRCAGLRSQWKWIPLKGKRRGTLEPIYGLTGFKAIRNFRNQKVWLPVATSLGWMATASERESLPYFLPFQAIRNSVKTLGWQHHNEVRLQLCDMLSGLEDFWRPWVPRNRVLTVIQSNFSEEWKGTVNAYYTLGAVRCVISSNPHNNLVKDHYLQFIDEEPQSQRH